MENKKWTIKLPKHIPKGLFKKDQLLIILLAGILLVIAIPSGSKKSGKAEEKGGGASSQKMESLNGNSTNSAYVHSMESELSKILSQMEGVGEATVMITLQSSAERVVEKDIQSEQENVTEEDSQGGTRSTTNAVEGETTIYDGGTSDVQSPYVSKELTPKVEGVVILADGGADAVVREEITDAVQALFGVDTHKIKIMKKR